MFLSLLPRWVWLVRFSLADSDCEIVKPQPFSISRKRQASHVESEGDMNAARPPDDVQPLSRRRTQEEDCGVNRRWPAVYQAVARRMLSYLDNSEALKVDTKELEDHVFAPNEPRVDINHIARQARGEQHQRLFQIFSRQGAKEILVASVARCEQHLRMLIVLERKCLDLSGGATDRVARILAHSDGEQEESAKSRPGSLMRRSSRVGGAEIRRGSGAVGTHAQGWENWRGKGIEPGCYRKGSRQEQLLWFLLALFGERRG